MSKYRVIIAGSRDFDDYQMLELNCNYFLKNKLPDVEVVSGGARGADRLGERYAENYLLDIRVFTAEWDQFGKSAGYIRNKEMGEYCDAGIAFWNGVSRGSKHMIDILKELGKPYRVVGF